MTAQGPANGVRPPSGRSRGRAEQAASFIILGILAIIGAGVLLRQMSFNPAVLVARDAGLQFQGASPPPAPDAIPPQLQALGQPESFNSDNLYDKIDGKAELYLAAGFSQLHCARFALKQAPEQWFEWFDYQMTNLPAAFSVFSVQRRAEGKPLELTEYSYRTQNALYFVCGTNYVEVIASVPNEPLLKALAETASRFVASNPATRTRIEELDLFPTQDLVASSQTLQIADAFGFEGLRDVFTARFRADGTEQTAFLASCANAPDAEHLRDAYAAFLLGNGGKELAASNRSERRIEIMGGTELVFSEGRFLGGIHAATALSPAELVAIQLREKLRSASKAQ